MTNFQTIASGAVWALLSVLLMAVTLAPVPVSGPESSASGQRVASVGAAQAHPSARV